MLPITPVRSVDSRLGTTVLDAEDVTPRRARPPPPSPPVVEAGTGVGTAVGAAEGGILQAQNRRIAGLAALQWPVAASHAHMLAFAATPPGHVSIVP